MGREGSVDVKFLYMDEKYADIKAPKGAQAVSLTGVLVPANLHGEFRDRYYALVGAALGDLDHKAPKWPDQRIHASNLLPGATNDDRYSFLEGLVRLVNEFEFRIFRLGHVRTPENVTALDGELGLVGTSFHSLLTSLRNKFPETQVWPVMEIDRSDRQDRIFAGTVQRLDYMAARRALPDQALWWKDSNFGEVLYVTKTSSYGSMVDCVSYLLHLKWLDSIGHPLTPFKKRLAEIAIGLSTIALNSVRYLVVDR